MVCFCCSQWPGVPRNWGKRQSRRARRPTALQQYKKISHLWDSLVAGVVTKCTWKKAVMQWYCNYREYGRKISHLLRTAMTTMKKAARVAVVLWGKNSNSQWKLNLWLSRPQVMSCSWENNCSTPTMQKEQFLVWSIPKCPGVIEGFCKV